MTFYHQDVVEIKAILTSGAAAAVVSVEGLYQRLDHFYLLADRFFPSRGANVGFAIVFCLLREDLRISLRTDRGICSFPMPTEMHSIRYLLI